MKIRIKDKKGFILRDLVVASLLLTGIIALYVLSIAGISNEYPSSNITDSSFDTNYNQLNSLADRVDNMRNVTSTGKGLTVLTAFGVAFEATFSVIQLVFSSLALIASLPAKFLVDFTFIDSMVVANLFVIGLSILTVITVFVIISSLGRNKT